MSKLIQNLFLWAASVTHQPSLLIRDSIRQTCFSQIHFGGACLGSVRLFN